VDGDASREKWKRPFQKKVTASISKEKRDLQSAKFAKMKSAEAFLRHSTHSIILK
jgi:hypothetical protein